MTYENNRAFPKNTEGTLAPATWPDRGELAVPLGTRLPRALCLPSRALTQSQSYAHTQLCSTVTLHNHASLYPVRVETAQTGHSTKALRSLRHDRCKWHGAFGAENTGKGSSRVSSSDFIFTEFILKVANRGQGFRLFTQVTLLTLHTFLCSGWGRSVGFSLKRAQVTEVWGADFPSGVFAVLGLCQPDNLGLKAKLGHCEEDSRRRWERSAHSWDCRQNRVRGGVSHSHTGAWTLNPAGLNCEVQPVLGPRSRVGSRWDPADAEGRLESYSASYGLGDPNP